VYEDEVGIINNYCGLIIKLASVVFDKEGVVEFTVTDIIELDEIVVFEEINVLVIGIPCLYLLKTR